MKQMDNYDKEIKPLIKQLIKKYKIYHKELGCYGSTNECLKGEIDLILKHKKKVGM